MIQVLDLISSGILKWRRLRKYMNQRMIILIFFLFNLANVSYVYAQGITRSKGIGIRGGTWKLKDANSTSFGGVSSSGGSGSIYFFSRFKELLFLETSIGGVGKSNIGGGVVESSSIIPFLFGVDLSISK